MTVTDREWASHVENGEAFVSEIFQTGVPAQLGFIQLFNPLGAPEPVRVRLRHLGPFAIFSIAINTNIRRHDVALPGLGGFTPAHNLLSSGGAVAVAEQRFHTQVAMLGSPFWLILSTGPTRKNYPALHMDWGHDLLPGQGIMLQSSFGGFIFGGFEWAEVPL